MWSKRHIRTANKDFDDIPIIDMNPFRKVLSNEYSTSFPLNEPGDSQSFFNYLNTVLISVESLLSVKQEIIESALQIHYLESSKSKDTEIVCDNRAEGNLKFLAYKAIPYIEKCNKTIVEIFILQL